MFRNLVAIDLKRFSFFSKNMLAGGAVGSKDSLEVGWKASSGMDSGIKTMLIHRKRNGPGKKKANRFFFFRFASAFTCIGYEHCKRKRKWLVCHLNLVNPHRPRSLDHKGSWLWWNALRTRMPVL